MCQNQQSTIANDRNQCCAQPVVIGTPACNCVTLKFRVLLVMLKEPPPGQIGCEDICPIYNWCLLQQAPGQVLSLAGSTEHTDHHHRDASGPLVVPTDLVASTKRAKQAPRSSSPTIMEYVLRVLFPNNPCMQYLPTLKPLGSRHIFNTWIVRAFVQC